MTFLLARSKRMKDDNEKAAPKGAPAKRGPLAGLRVIDAGQMIAAPLACTLMADFGADVIKIEHPTNGDAMRHRPPEREGKSLWWKVIDRNKRNITLNLSKPEGQALLKRLAGTADILVENYRPGTFERWGLGFDELSRINPRLVLVRVSGYGQTGPYAQRGGYGTVAEAFTGVPSFTGFPDGPPTLTSSFAMADSIAATFATMAAMFAIYERDQGGSGKGQVVDVSLFEPLFRLVEFQVIAYDQIGLVRERIGNRSTTDLPRNAYRTRDGRYITISASTQKSFDRLVAAMGMVEPLPRPPLHGRPLTAAQRRRARHDHGGLVPRARLCRSVANSRSRRGGSRPDSHDRRHLQ